jgi:DNA-binding Lrp family transcriptional regulator
MIGNKLEQSIISVFQYNLSKTFSINEISKQLRKSYPTINHKSNFFLKEGILKKIDIGRSYQCFLNLSNDKTKILISTNEVNNKEVFLEKNRDFSITYEKISSICESQSYKKKISFVLLYGMEIIFVLDSLDQEIVTEIQSSVPASTKYKFLFLTEELFKVEFLNNNALQKNHVLLFNIPSYVQLLESMVDKLLTRGFINLTKNDDIKKNINKKELYKNKT